METGPDYSLCRNLLWEVSVRDRRRVPGRYCVTSLGVISALDCPVFQGLRCCLYDPRAEGEEPRVPSEDEIEAIRDRLVEDHLRWPYWRRVHTLRGAVAPPPPAPPPPPDPEDMDREEDELGEIAAAPLLAPADEAPPEKYPGQRRSEDRHRSRHGGAGDEEDEEGEDEEPADSGVPPDAGAPAAPPPAGPPAGGEPPPVADPPQGADPPARADPPSVADPPAEGASASQGPPPRERRRGRRRRRRRGGDRPPAPGGAPPPKEE